MNELLQPPTWKDFVKHPYFNLLIHHAKFGIVTTIFGVLAVVALCIGHVVTPGLFEPYTWEILISVPVTLLCTGVCSTFYELYIRTTFTSSMRSVYWAWDTGVTVMPTHASAPDRKAVLDSARTEVRLISTTFSRYFLGVTDLVERKAASGVRFRFIIYDPNSKAIDEKAKEENCKVDDFRDEIRSTCRRYLGPLVRKYKHRVQVRFCDFNVPFGITVIDDSQMVLSLNIYGMARSRNETPCLMIQNKHEPHSVFGLYKDSFDAIWTKLKDQYPPCVREYFEPEKPTHINDPIAQPLTN
jgi:hypothetical protein